MRDGNDGHVSLFGFGKDEIPDLRLRDYIQHRADFVANQIVRAAHQGPRHAEPLQFAAGKLAGKARKPCRFNSERIQQLRVQ